MIRCKALFQERVLPGAGEMIPDDAFSMPKWVFMEYLVKFQNTLLHGSPQRIAQFEPRSSQDNIVNGHLPRVYAASSGIMATFYAIIDRPFLAKHGVGAINVFYAPYHDVSEKTCDGFQFAVDYRCLPKRPYQKGFVHVLSRKTLRSDYMGIQWCSEVAVGPQAVIEMRPEDFPLLPAIRGIDWEVLARNHADAMDGFPWVDDKSLYPSIAKRTI